MRTENRRRRCGYRTPLSRLCWLFLPPLFFLAASTETVSSWQRKSQVIALINKYITKSQSCSHACTPAVTFYKAVKRACFWRWPFGARTVRKAFHHNETMSQITSAPHYTHKCTLALKHHSLSANSDGWIWGATVPAEGMKIGHNTFLYSEQRKKKPKYDIKQTVTYFVFTTKHIHSLYIKWVFPSIAPFSLWIFHKRQREADDSSPPLDFLVPSAPPIHCAKWYIYIGHNLNHHACRLCWMCRQTFLQWRDADSGIMGAIDRNPRPRHPSNQTTPLQ